MRINFKHCASVLILLFFVLLALGSGTTEQAVKNVPIEPDITKTVDISFGEFLDVAKNVSSSTLYSFDAYIGNVSEDGQSSAIVALQGPGIWDWGPQKPVPQQPYMWITYDSEKHPIAGRYKVDRAYKFYVFVQVTAGYNGTKRVPELYQLDGLMTAEEVALANAEKEEAEAVARAERIKAIDEQAKSLARGYTYHGVNEDDQSALLFDGGALEDGHAYYITGFMVAGGGSTAGVTTQTFFGRLGDPKSYHLVEYASQKVKGDVVSAGQTMFGTLPVTVVVAGGKPPLRIPIVLGLVK
jgi:hypothetical protein